MSRGAPCAAPAASRAPTQGAASLSKLTSCNQPLIWFQLAIAWVAIFSCPSMLHDFACGKRFNDKALGRYMDRVFLGIFGKLQAG